MVAKEAHVIPPRNVVLVVQSSAEYSSSLDSGSFFTIQSKTVVENDLRDNEELLLLSVTMLSE